MLRSKDNPLKPSKNPLAVKNAPFKTGLPARSPGHITPKGLIKPQSIEFHVADLKIKLSSETLAKPQGLKKIEL